MTGRARPWTSAAGPAASPSCSPFEQWRPARRGFDLVTAGTAWHWVDPTIGYDRAASALRSDGRLAIFRNSYEYDAEVATIIQRNLRHHAPHLLTDCVPLGTANPSRFDTHRAEVECLGDLFAGVEPRAFRHERALTVAAWIRDLTTHSPLMLLNRGVRDRLLADLAREVTSEVGDSVHMAHETHCLLATRR